LSDLRSLSVVALLALFVAFTGMVGSGTLRELDTGVLRAAQARGLTVAPRPLVSVKNGLTVVTPRPATGIYLTEDIIWYTVRVAVVLLVAPLSALGIAAIALLVSYRLQVTGDGAPSITSRPWRRAAEVLSALAIVVLICSALIPWLLWLISSFSELTFSGYYPDVYVTSGIAFYGFIAYRTWRSSKSPLLRCLVTALLAYVPIAVGGLPVWTGDAWLTDVAGGLLLGITICAGALFAYDVLS
jgi:hypothetical protein